MSTLEARAPSGAKNKGRTAPIVMLIALGVQYVIGIYVNLYVPVPHMSASGMGSMSSMHAMGGAGPIFMAHMMLGIVIGIASLIVVALGASGGAGRVAWAAVGALGVVGGGVAGMAFLTGGQSNGASFAMAIGLAVACIGYVGEIAAS